jgi:mxaA protein
MTALWRMAARIGSAALPALFGIACAADNPATQAEAPASVGSPSLNAQTAAVVSLRDTGYLLGDLLDESVAIALPHGYAVDADSLPLTGRVAPWLEVRGARVAPGNGGEAVVTVTYQIFAEVEQAARVPLPGFRLRLRGGDRTQVVQVPEKSFLLSPALPPALSDQDRELKPSPAPQPLPRGWALAGFVIGVLAALLCAGWLLWVHDRLPFLPRAPGPFARLWRRWRRHGRREMSGEEQVVLLRDWHAALNQAAGETLYASTLPRLFVRAPFLAPLREDVERTFARSWQSFYAVPAGERPAAGEILEIARSAAARERGVPC